MRHVIAIGIVRVPQYSAMAPLRDRTGWQEGRGNGKQIDAFPLTLNITGQWKNRKKYGVF